MPKMTEKEAVKVKVNIRSGSVPPAQKTVWRKFWQKIISEVKANEHQ